MACRESVRALNEALRTLFLAEIANLGKAEQKGLVQPLGKLEKFNVRLVCAATAAARHDGRWPFRRGSIVRLGLDPRAAIADHQDVPDIAATALTQLIDANEAAARSRPRLT